METPTTDCTPSSSKDSLGNKNLFAQKLQKYKEFRKCSKSSPNFLTSKKKIILKSYFDHKGAKKFLAEKEKAMEEIILNDEIIEKEINNKKTKGNKILKNNTSHNTRNQLNEKNKLKNKKKNREKNEKVKYSENFNSENNIEEIVKINQKSKKTIESIKNHISNQRLNEPSYLFTGEGDSFIYSILNQMSIVGNF